MMGAVDILRLLLWAVNGSRTSYLDFTRLTPKSLKSLKGHIVLQTNALD